MIYLNGVAVQPTLFPDHTTQVWKLPKESLVGDNIDVKWDFTSEADLIHLAQLRDLIERENCFNIEGTHVKLSISYLPYARQDKEVSNSATFALRTFARILNSLNFHEVEILDPHSEIALDLIKNSKAIYPKQTLSKIVAELKSDIICYPDKGAVTKYTKIYSRNYIYGEKVRDQLTGNITSYKVVGECKGKKVLIVDDICDGGMTFKILAKDLLAMGATEVNLFVTHGIFSKGIKTLKESGISRVFTQDGEASEVQGYVVYAKV